MNHTSRKTWLLLGGAGFIGTHLTNLLLSKGQKVISYDVACRATSAYNKRQINILNQDVVMKNYESINTVNLDVTQLMCRMKECDYIINLASVVGVSNVNNDPSKTIHSNLELSTLVDGINRNTMKPLFYASSSEVYGDIPEGVDRLTEDMETRLGATSDPRTSYAAVKRLVESIVIHAPYPAVVGRFFNVTGACQDPGKGVVPAMVHSAVTHGKVNLIFGGEQTRSFTHVSTICNYIYRLMTTPSTYNEVYNLGSGDDEVTMKYLANTVIHHVEKTGVASDIQISMQKLDEKDPFDRRIPCTKKVEAALGVKGESIELGEIVMEVLHHILDKYFPANRQLEQTIC